MPVLVLLRHAKAEQLAATDHARPLNERGRADAAAVRLPVVPGRVVVSSAVRAQETAALAGLAGETDDRVYDADTADLRAVVAETDPLVEVVVLIGHNPGLERLAWELDDTAAGMATCTYAVLDVSDWYLTAGALREVVTVRG